MAKEKEKKKRKVKKSGLYTVKVASILFSVIALKAKESRGTQPHTLKKWKLHSIRKNNNSISTRGKAALRRVRGLEGDASALLIKSADARPSLLSSLLSSLPFSVLAPL